MKIAEAFVDVSVRPDDLRRSMPGLQGFLVTKLAEAGTAAGGKFASAMLAASATAMTALGGFLLRSTGAALEAEKAYSRLASVVAATGGAAGFTARELAGMASDLQKVTTFEDEATMGAQAVLLTFKQIKGDMFHDALGAAMDLATVMQTDLKGAALQVGKALQDPLKGITALSRAGVSFSEDQKKMIAGLVETNQLAKAQAMILAELNSEFGGAAKGVGRGDFGKFEILKNEFGELAEVIGSDMIPIILKDVENLKALGEWAGAVADVKMPGQSLTQAQNAAAGREADFARAAMQGEKSSDPTKVREAIATMQGLAANGGPTTKGMAALQIKRMQDRLPELDWAKQQNDDDEMLRKMDAESRKQRAQDMQWYAMRDQPNFGLSTGLAGEMEQLTEDFGQMVRDIKNPTETFDRVALEKWQQQDRLGIAGGFANSREELRKGFGGDKKEGRGGEFVGLTEMSRRIQHGVSAQSDPVVKELKVHETIIKKQLENGRKQLEKLNAMEKMGTLA